MLFLLLLSELSCLMDALKPPPFSLPFPLSELVLLLPLLMLVLVLDLPIVSGERVRPLLESALLSLDVVAVERVRRRSLCIVSVSLFPLPTVPLDNREEEESRKGRARRAICFTSHQQSSDGRGKAKASGCSSTARAQIPLLEHQISLHSGNLCSMSPTIFSITAYSVSRTAHTGRPTRKKRGHVQ